VDHPENVKRVPFDAQNPNGPLEICLCTDCGAVLMLDDRQKRIRVAVPNIMGHDDALLTMPESDLPRLPGRDVRLCQTVRQTPGP
jgi:hypothetical protein